MPRIEFVEKTIYKKEGLDVKFFKDKKDVRSDASVPSNYKSGRMTKNSANVSFFKEKLKKQFPGYDFEIYDGEGNKQRGNALLGNIRDTYVDEEGE